MNSTPSFKRTRLAPTPSGFLHLGNAFSFALTAALANKWGARLLLRIDDLDRDRVEDIYVEDIFETLHFLEIFWDEGPRGMGEYERRYAQVHRMDLYGRALEELREKSAVFACNCSRSKIQLEKPEGIYPGTCRNKGIPLDDPGVAWRLRTEGIGKATIKTLEGAREMALTKDMQDFIVRKKDGFPSYQLASVIDDLHFGVDLIVRGEDLWHSTIAQHGLAKILEKETFKDITFHHHPLIREGQNQKLSKSAGSTSIQFLRKQGKTAAEVFAMIGGLMELEGKVNSWETLGAAIGI